VAHKRKRTVKWKKIRSGRRVLGMIMPLEGGPNHLWKGNSKIGTGDSGVSGTREQAVNNVLRTVSGSGTPDGYRRQYDVNVED